MLETLLKILAINCRHGAPEISLEDDGCICLDYYTINDGDPSSGIAISIWPDGGLSWAAQGLLLGETGHGSDLNVCLQLLETGKISSATEE